MPDDQSVPVDLPRPVDDGAAAHLPGTAMPALTLTTSTDQQLDLSALGTGCTVLYIYPLTAQPGSDLPSGWDAIPGARGCTPEACAFRDHHEDILAAGAEAVFGLSSQLPDYQREVAERLHLPFAMVSDPTLALARALSLPTFKADGITLYARLTLVVTAGRIEHVFYPIFPTAEHAQEVLTWLRETPLASP